MGTRPKAHKADSGGSLRDSCARAGLKMRCTGRRHPSGFCRSMLMLAGEKVVSFVSTAWPTRDDSAIFYTLMHMLADGGFRRDDGRGQTRRAGRQHAEQLGGESP